MFTLTYLFVIYIMHSLYDQLFLEDEEKEIIANSITSNKDDEEEFIVKLMNASKNKFANSTIMKKRNIKKEKQK